MKKVFLISIIISIVLTSLERKFSLNAIILQTVPIEYYLNLNFLPFRFFYYFPLFLFWFSGSLTFLLLLKHPKWKSLLIFIGVIALLLMWIEIKTDNSCLKGYPIHFLSVCTDVTTPNNPFWLFVILNFIFWAVITLVGTFIFLQTHKSPYLLIRLLVPPLILTIYSLVIQSSCSGFFICFFPKGRGFPLPFTDEGALVFLGIDYAFWWIVYNTVIFIKRKMFHPLA